MNKDYETLIKSCAAGDVIEELATIAGPEAIYKLFKNEQKKLEALQAELKSYEGVNVPSIINRLNFNINECNERIRIYRKYSK